MGLRFCHGTALCRISAFYANLHFAENFYAAAAAYRLEKEK